MSINVTVSGNPISIKRGKMVTSAYDPSKKEFEKRRLMRLEQVRHQSKNIAENVRNKVQKEKSKQLSEVEKEGEIRLKNWQARKLLELQNQYQEALSDIGLGHKQADTAKKDEEILLGQRQSNEDVARERGRVAAERLQVEKNEESLKKATPVQRKKISRDIENSRSHIVASLNKSKQSKSPFKKRKILVAEESFDSDSENQMPTLNLDVDRSVTPSFRLSLLEDPLESASSRRENTDVKVSREQQTSKRNDVSTRDKEAQTLAGGPISVTNNQQDTRISQRIKRRQFLDSQPDYCDQIERELESGRTADENHTRTVKCQCCQCPQKHHPLVKEREVQTDDCPQKLHATEIPSKDYCEEYLKSNFHQFTKDSQQLIDENLHHPSVEDFSVRPSLKTSRRDKSPKKHSRSKDKKAHSPSLKPTLLSKSKKDSGIEKSQEIPKKPKITLRSAKYAPKENFESLGSEKVQYYDHPNRFAKEYLPKSSHVEKIDEDNLIISPNLSEDDIRGKIRQQDLEAHIRGKIALEKEKVSRDYRDLLKKLPILQKQERIAEIGIDREKYHMSQERLQGLERKNQNHLDNVYEDLFLRRQPPKVTLTSKYPSKETPPSNAATWDTDFGPSRNRTQEQDTSNKSRSEQLTDLLSTLRKQKKILLTEIENSLPPESVTQLISKSSSDEIKSKSSHYFEVKRDKTKRKTSKRERVTSPSSSEESVDNKVDKQSATSASSFRNQSSQTKIAPSPRKKSKRTLVLQNTSTQTSPKHESVSTSPIAQKATDQPCECKPTDELCEIVIKIKDDEQPEVTVNPSTFQGTVKVVTEEQSSSKQDETTVKNAELTENRNAKVSDKSTKKHIARGKPTRTNGSWREQFSHTSSISTASTSYMDPPNVVRMTTARTRQTAKLTQPGAEQNNSCINASRSSKSSKSLDPRLLTYVKKLLQKSHASIDNLTVSSDSTVTTPSQSLVETQTNNPLLQLRNVMKYFNLDPAELGAHLKAMEDEELHNTCVSVAGSSTTTSSDAEKTVRFQSCIDFEKTESVDLSNVTSTTQYKDIAQSCNKKISDLTAMIEKVREEKKRMLQITPVVSESSDLENTSTSYLNLPPTRLEEDKDSMSSSLSDDLVNVDYGYAEKLKRYTPEQIETEKQKFGVGEATSEQLLDRLANILQRGTDTTDVTATQTEDFAPLLDIPKLPKLQAPSFNKQKPRPPPSKGLRNLNMNAPIPTIPHELSTIAEADSQLSTKFDSSAKLVSPPKSPKTTSPKLIPDILTELSQVESKQSEMSISSDDKSEIEAMEGMLKSIGMEWAIPTLKKTREALALTSSSSSSSSKKDTSSLTLKEFLSRMSTSNSAKSGESGACLLSETQELSLIQQDNCRTSTPVQGYKKDELGRDGKSNFLTDSDISSVREQSGSSKDRFYDLNDRSDKEPSRSSNLRFYELNDGSASNILDREVSK